MLSKEGGGVKTKDDVDYMARTIERFAVRTTEALRAAADSRVEAVKSEVEAAMQRMYKAEALDALRALVQTLDVLALTLSLNAVKPEMDRAREVLARHEGETR
jgi:hypothetical protein